MSQCTLIAGAVRAVALRDAPHIQEEGLWHMEDYQHYQQLPDTHVRLENSAEVKRLLSH